MGKPHDQRRGTDTGGRGRAVVLGGAAALRARIVRRRKEALQYSVERLEMEVGEKERELRLRLDKA